MTEFDRNEQLFNVLLEDMSLISFRVESKNEKRNLHFSNREYNEICLVRVLLLQCPGNQIVSLSFLTFNKAIQNAFDAGPQFIVCFNDGSFLIVDPMQKDKETIFFKPKFRKQETIHFKIVDINSNAYLLLGSNKFLYIMSMSIMDKNHEQTLHLAEIPGNFENGIFVRNKNVVGIDKTNIFFYSVHIDLPNNRYKIRKDKQINAHEDEITFLFLADKQFIFTASKDSSIKAFFSNKTRCDSIQFDKTKSEITNIMILDESHVISLESLR